MGVSTRRTARPSPKEVKEPAKAKPLAKGKTPAKTPAKTPKKSTVLVERAFKPEIVIQNLADVVAEFRNTNGEFDHFFVSNEKKCEKYKNITKHLYDHLQKKRDNFDTKLQTKLQKSETMKSLIVKGFDNEQIWQQLEMYNRPLLKNIVADVASFTNKQALVTLNVDMGQSKSTTKTKAPAKEEEEGKGSKRNAKVVFDDDSDDMEELEEDFPEEEEDEHRKSSKNKKQNKKNHKVNPEKVDFFDLKEMQAFLDAEDEKEMNDNEDKTNDDEDDERIDYFADHPSDDEDDENEDEDEMYNDFFDPPQKKETKKVMFQTGDNNDDQDAEENDEEEDEEIEGLDIRDFDGDGDVEDDEDEEDELLDPKEIFANSSSEDEDEDVHTRLRNLAAQNFGDQSDDDLEGKSEFEKSQILLKRKIEKAQRGLLQPAALNWKLAGEAISNARPENSLLEEHLDFDHISRPAPVITDDTTKTLEDLIRQRIKDKAFDDVERKSKPKEVPFEFRRRLMLESEKSKVGLAEVYEQEYMKKQQESQQEGQQAGGFVAAGKVEESENRKQIGRMMKSLFRKLDALSSFHFTPRAPEADVKIINNMPAISVEEATPDMGSGKSLIAPEEVFNTRNKKVLQAPGERDSTDRKRARRIKKKKQGVKRLLDEKKHGVSASAANKAEIAKLKAGVKEPSSGLKKTFTSSGKFFERLQETKDAVNAEKKRKKKPVESNLAKKLKLN